MLAHKIQEPGNRPTFNIQKMEKVWLHLFICSPLNSSVTKTVTMSNCKASGEGLTRYEVEGNSHYFIVVLSHYMPVRTEETMKTFNSTWHPTPWLLHFSHDRSNWSSPSFSITIFQNFPGVSDLLPEASKFQHHIKLCSKCSTLLVSYYIYIFFFSVALQSDTSYGPVILEVSRSHATMHHSQ